MQAGQLEYFFDPGPSKLSKGTNATWLSDIGDQCVGRAAPASLGALATLFADPSRRTDLVRVCMTGALARIIDNNR